MNEKVFKIELKHNINKIIGFGVWTIILVFVLRAPQYMGWIVLGLIIVLSPYGYYYWNYKRKIEKKILNFLKENKGKKFYSDEIADSLNINSAWTVFKICNRLHERGLIK